MESFDVTIYNSDHLKCFYDELWPFYERMYRHRIKPVADAPAADTPTADAPATDN